jgi:C_GCAxxG_C_C family probable redox protein
MLKELLASGYGKEQNYCCSEKLFYGANEAYQLHLPPEALKLSAAFCGGMGLGAVCGAMSASFMVLAHLYVKEKNHESTRDKELNQEFAQKFKAQLGTWECKDLKAKYPSPAGNGKCDINFILTTAAGILDEMVTREGLPR